MAFLCPKSDSQKCFEELPKLPDSGFESRSDFSGGGKPLMYAVPGHCEAVCGYLISEQESKDEKRKS